MVNGLNNDGLGDIIRFVAQHIEKIHGVAFQPVMFCGRDEEISADERYARRYPVSQTPYDLQAETSFGWEPMRDWFPASAYALFASLCDMLRPEAVLVREPFLRYPSQSGNFLPNPYQLPHTRNCPCGKVLRGGAIPASRNESETCVFSTARSKGVFGSALATFGR